MIPLTTIFRIIKRIGIMLEVEKKINGNVEYTLIPINTISVINSKTYISKKIVDRKSDFFCKVDSLKG